MNSSNNKVYKVTNKLTNKTYIGTTYKLAQDLYMAQGSVQYLTKKVDTRDYICEFIGYKRIVYKVSYEGEIFEGTAKEIADKFNMTEQSVREMFHRQRKGTSTKLRLLGERDEVFND